MNRLDADVIVSGAGPVGLTLALGLAHRGVRTLVLERKKEPDSHSRATLLPPRSLEVLASVGVLPSILDQGHRNHALDIRRAGDRKRILRFDFSSAAHTTAVPFAIAIPQDRTERILLDAVRATKEASIRFGSPLQSFRDDGEHLMVTLSSGETLTAHFLVGADGAHSSVREQLGWNLEGTTYPTRAFLADVLVTPGADLRDGWLADPRAASFTLAIRFGDDQDGGRWRLIESAIPDTVADADFAGRAHSITERIFGGGSWRETRWTAAYRKHERRADRYHTGRVVLAGDAAHLNSPAGGQGLNTGLQDAHALGWRLARLVRGEGDRARLLDSYTQERIRAFDVDVRPFTDGIERMETWPRQVRATAFAAARILARTPLPEAITRRMSMLSPSPVHSILVRGGEPAGRRLPNVVLPDGRRLYELIGEDGLLLTVSDQPAPGDAGRLAVARMPGALPATFAAHGDLLIRPDHLIGAAAGDRNRLSDDTIRAALGAR